MCENQGERRFCEECNTEADVVIKERNTTRFFRKEAFDIVEKYAECVEFGHEVYDEKTANDTLKQLSQLYQERHSFTPQDIKSIRKSTGLTQSIFAKVLNMGEATIKRYETGASLPDGTQLSILKMLLQDPANIIKFYEDTKTKFSEEEQHIIEKKLEHIKQDSLIKSNFDLLHTLYTKYDQSVLNGFSRFNPEKLFNMILFFSERGVLKTKLMKLLWYSDFLMYQKNQLSISGTPYWHKEFGPVPVEHDTILGCGTSMSYILINEEEDISSGYTKMLVKSNTPINLTLFSEQELQIMDSVQTFFSNYGSRDISNFSHEEDAWQQTQEKEMISYEFAETIKLINTL